MACYLNYIAFDLANDQYAVVILNIAKRIIKFYFDFRGWNYLFGNIIRIDLYSHMIIKRFEHDCNLKINDE